MKTIINCILNIIIKTINMENTVTISVKEYDDLRKLKETINKECITIIISDRLNPFETSICYYTNDEFLKTMINEVKYHTEQNSKLKIKVDFNESTISRQQNEINNRDTIIGTKNRDLSDLTEKLNCIARMTILQFIKWRWQVNNFRP